MVEKDACKIVKITWKSEDGFQFMGIACNQEWDVVPMTPKALAQMDVGCYVHCRRTSHEDFGIHMEERIAVPFATEEEWLHQEQLHQINTTREEV